MTAKGENSKTIVNIIGIVGTVVFIFKTVLLLIRGYSLSEALPLDSLLFDLLPLILLICYYLYVFIINLLEEWQSQRTNTQITICIVILALLLNIRPLMFFLNLGNFFVDTSLDEYWYAISHHSALIKILLMAHNCPATR
jgi:hypothetical protein